jgi:hypothetical protein
MSENRFTRFCIKGLEKAYIPSEQIFAIRRLINGQMVHIRDREHEYLFTMLALLGLSRAQQKGSEVFIDIDAVYQRTALKIDEQLDQNPCIAATAWAGRSIGTKIPSKAASLFHELLRNARQNNIGPKSLGWLMAACLNGGEEYYADAHSLAKLVAEKYMHGETSLIKQVSNRFRRNWSFLGSHSYMAYTFLLLSRKTGDKWARDIGLSIARRLVQLQGKNGEWAWMYHTPTGKVADFYPAYSIHQSAYAPFFLSEAIDQGYDEFRGPLVKGFRWILGQNELGQTMVDSKHNVIWRRILRKGVYNSAAMKALRGYGVICGIVKSAPTSANAIEIDQQCHGFEMGLPLCIFSGRSDLSEILDDECFGDKPE